MRKSFTSTILATAVLAGIVSPAHATDKGDSKRYEVTITNLTRGQSFTPLLAATHTDKAQFFKLGEAASPELSTLAEEGSTAPLMMLLEKTGQVSGTATSSGLLAPGKSVTLMLTVGRNVDRLSLAAMLIPTNDAFMALNGKMLPRSGTQTWYVPAYDAGSEMNDEKCASVPGPFFEECAGPGGGAAPKGGEEGFVHVHAGIHGVGDLMPALRDWRNPVARITVKRSH